MRTRRAVSLLELLLIMSACAVVLTLTGVLLQRAMRIQMQSRATAASERTALRLASQFRRDVHEATATTVREPVEKQDTFLRLELDGGRSVEYSRLEGVVLRQESGNDKRAWREEFVIPAVSKLSIEKTNAPERLMLTITANPGEQQAAPGRPLAGPVTAPMSFHVEAVVGHQLRFRDARAAQEAPE